MVFCLVKLCKAPHIKNTYNSPPEGVSIAIEILPLVTPFCEVNKIRGEDETKEPYIQSRDQLLQAKDTEVRRVL